MKAFSVLIDEGNDHIVLKVSGSIDNLAELPIINKMKNVVLNLSDVTMMNSFGVKTWCRWAIKHKDLPKIYLEKCPFILTKHFSSIRGFLGENMMVRSFYVPFYNDASNESKDVLLVSGENFVEDRVYNMPKVLDSLGQEMTMDVDQKSYFLFLKKNRVV